MGNAQDKCDTLSLWVHTKFCVKLEASFTNKLLVISLAVYSTCISQVRRA